MSSFRRKLLSVIPDFIYLHMRYYVELGRIPNIMRPVRFTEKMQWYKLNYKHSLLTECSDKYAVREYIIRKGFGHTLVKLYQSFINIDDFDLDSLPQQFVIKSNNGSGTNIFVKDKRNFSFEMLNSQINIWRQDNDVIWRGREWCYKNIPFRVVVEEYLDIANESGVNDYKFLCFNGRCKYVWVDQARFTNHNRTFFSPEWKRIEVESDKPVSEYYIPKPQGYDEMLIMAESIAKDFPFVRVDFYSVNSKVYFGELTFYPWSGIVQFTPDDFDFEMGYEFDLNQ